MSCDLTLFNLFNFMPLNDNEKKLYNFDKIIISRFNRELDEGFFYLGGQINMSHNDTINLDSIQQVREIREQKSIEYGPPCNSFEAARIYTTQKEIELIESMIKVYNVIMEIRGKEKLNKDNSNYNI